MNRSNLLIVDDEKPILQSLNFMFRREYNVSTATSAEDAMVLIDNDEYEVEIVLSDQRMGGMHGHELLKLIHDKRPYVVGILLTGYSDMESLIKAVNDGHIYSYIAKPWDNQQLKILLKKAEEHYKLVNDKLRLTIHLHKTNHELQTLNSQFKKQIHELKLALEQKEQANHNNLEIALNDTPIKKSHSININQNIHKRQYQLLNDYLQIINSASDNEHQSSIQQLGDTLLQFMLNENNLLMQSKLMNNDMSIDYKEFNLNDCIQTILSLFSAEALKKTIHLKNQIEPNVPLKIYSDPLLLMTILLNLTHNAIQSTYQGDVVIHTDLQSCEGDDIVLQFSIIDTGLGIEPEQLDQLFDQEIIPPLLSNHHFPTINKGTIICKYLINILGGKISAISEINHGTTVTFSIKVSKY